MAICSAAVLVPLRAEPDASSMSIRVPKSLSAAPTQSFFADFPDGIKDKGHRTSVYVSDTKDLHTARKVSAGLGIPLHRLPNRTNYVMPDGTDVHLPTGNYEKSLEHVHAFAKEIG